MQHHFNVDIAKEFGINIAIFLDQMSFWITKNIANEKNFHDGTYWTRNTAEAYTIIFPYWNAKQIRKIISDCKKYKLINVGNYNKVKYDRTQWYSLTEYSAKLLNISIFPKGKMEVTKKELGSSEKGTPIPFTNTVTNTVRDRSRKRDASRLSPQKLPEDYKPNEDHQSLARQYNIDLNLELKKFMTYYKGKRKTDWPNQFLLWLLRSIDYKKVSKNKNEIINNELRSTVKEWKAGNPDYDRVHGKSH